MDELRQPDWKKGELYDKRIRMTEFSDSINLISEVKFDPNSNIPAHAHAQTDEIFYCVKGSGVFTNDHEEFQIKQGDMWVSRHGQMHSFKTDNGAHFLVMKQNYKKGDSFSEETE